MNLNNLQIKTTSNTSKVAEIAEVQVAKPVNNEWLSPINLLQESNSSPYPIHALPNGLGDAVREVLEFVQCPMALAACSALSALSVATQTIADVRRAEGLTSPVSLYLLAIAESGERKSTVDKHFTTAIIEWEKYQDELHKIDVKHFQATHDAWEMQYDGLKLAIKEAGKTQKCVVALTQKLQNLKDEEPQPVRVPRLIYGDVTPEQLGFSLAKNWPSGGLLSSEAGNVFGSHGMKADSAMLNMALLNILWDGGSHNIDRRGSECYKVQDVRLTMGLAVQADTLKAFFDNSKGLARGTGFLARFLIAQPLSTQGSRAFREPPTNWPKLTVFSERITELLNIIPVINASGGITPATLDFTKEAKLAWVGFHDEVENELRFGGNLTDARDVASKSADNVARLSALFHLYEYLGEGKIGKELVDSAIVIVRWHLYESKRFLNNTAIPTHISNAIKLEAYILKYCYDNRTEIINKTHALKNGPIRDKDGLNKSLNELIDTKRIRIVLDNRTSVIEVNPALLGGNYA